MNGQVNVSINVQNTDVSDVYLSGAGTCSFPSTPLLSQVALRLRGVDEKPLEAILVAFLTLKCCREHVLGTGRKSSGTRTATERTVLIDVILPLVYILCHENWKHFHYSMRFLVIVAPTSCIMAFHFEFVTSAETKS